MSEIPGRECFKPNHDYYFLPQNNTIVDDNFPRTKQLLSISLQRRLYFIISMIVSLIYFTITMIVIGHVSSRSVFQPVSCHWSLSIPPENITNWKIFLMFWRTIEETVTWNALTLGSKQLCNKYGNMNFH